MPDWHEYVRCRLVLPGLRPERHAEIVEDLARQLEEAYREARRSGATEAVARAAAEEHIGDWTELAAQLVTSARDRQARPEQWRDWADDRALERCQHTTFWSPLRQDLVSAWRAMRHSRGLTTMAVLSLALGIGANTAIFSVINGLMFRALPVPSPETLVSLSDPTVDGAGVGFENGERTFFSYHEYEGLRDGAGGQMALLAFNSDEFTVPVAVTDREDGQRANVVLASGTYYPVLGIPAAFGHVFGPVVDGAQLSSPVAVLSDAFWRTRLQADPSVIGHPIRLRDTTFTVIGVLRPGFSGLVVGYAPDIYVPLTMQQAVIPGTDMLTQPPGPVQRQMFLHVVARLRPGVTIPQADAVMNGVLLRTLNDDAATIADASRRRQLLEDTHLVVRSARYGLSPLRSEYQTPLLVLMGLVGLLLLLACANVANLLLSRATGRRREFALRVALGASRGRLIRQLLTESLVLASLGAAGGIWLGHLGNEGLLRLVSDNGSPVPLDAHLDATVLTFAAGLTLLTGLLFGLAPALRSTRLELHTVLREAAANVAGAQDGRRWPIGKVLAAVQVGLSVVLLVTADLFVRSLQTLSAVPLGYDSSRLLMVDVDPKMNGYTAVTVAPLYERLLSRLEAVPGVRHVSLSQNGLFYGGDSSDGVSFPDYPLPADTNTNARFDLIGAAYFATVGVPILVGRDVVASDATAVPACWLNETMRQRFFQSADPIGQRMVVHYSFGDGDCVIRGVVADARANGLRARIQPRFYLPFAGAITRPIDAVLILNLSGESSSVTAEARRALREVNPAFRTARFHTVADLLSDLLVGDRLTARLSSLFGSLAILLAAIGLYGVLSYSITRRVTEIGVRMALGAGRGEIVRLIGGESARVTAAGALVGLLAALGATRLLTSLLYQLSPWDPTSVLMALGVLALVSVAATAVPAWRASRTDPIIAMRAD